MSLSREQVDAVFDLYDKGNAAFGSNTFPVESKQTRHGVTNEYFFADVEVSASFHIGLQKQLYDLGEDRVQDKILDGISKRYQTLPSIVPEPIADLTWPII